MRIGIYNPYIQTRGGGEKVTAVMAEYLSQEHEVILIVRETKEPLDLKPIEDYFDVDLRKVTVAAIEKHGPLFRLLTTRKLPWPERFRQLADNYSDYRKMKKLKLDIFFNNLYQSSSPSVAPLGIYMCMFPHKLGHKKERRGFVYGVYSFLMDNLESLVMGGKQAAINSYQLVTANSEYTKGWIKKLWHREAEIIYPVCEDMGPGNTEKEKIILNVGRFFANSGDNHHKRQDVLLQTFKKMTEAHQKGWQLHFVGSTAEDPDSLKFALELVKESQGLPVFFHFDAGFKQLESLYKRASIYWHATGYGFDTEKFPEKQEHFGITTVEAMSAGVVPVVINSAGQKETVEQGKNGILWNDVDELEFQTLRLINDPEALENLRRNCPITTKKFDKPAFNSHLAQLIKGASQ